MNSFKKAFTLIEIAITSVIFGIVLTTSLAIYFSLMKTKTDIYAKVTLIKNTNNLMEKINLIMKNYTIDYEEYFNRRIAGCNENNGGDSFNWNVGTGGYCKIFTNYGNGNKIDLSSVATGNHVLYYCTSASSNNNETPGGNDCEGESGNGITGEVYTFYNDEDKLKNGSGCRENVGGNNSGNGKLQSFGEYKLQFWDIRKNSDSVGGCQGDEDDTDLGNGPVAIGDNLHVKELYLISKNGKKRIFIRRKFIGSGDFNDDGQVGNLTGERLYKLQILKLRGFDIGSGHNVDAIDETYGDGQIDTRACDKREGFICGGSSIGSAYSDYKLPNSVDDGWVDFTIDDITVSQFDMAIFPTKNPDYAWADTGVQIYPYIRLKLETYFYPVNYKNKINPGSLSKYKFSLQTTFSIKPY